MRKPRQTSVVILITLAELAWLAAFGLLFAYRGKMGEVGSLQRRIEKIEAGAKGLPQLVAERDSARMEVTALKIRLATFTQDLEEATAQLEAIDKLRVEMKRKWDALPPNAAELSGLYYEASNNLARARMQLESAAMEITGLSNKIGQLELGEVAIRRELIGLPSANLRRVIFIVDTSSSMHNSPAWNDARSLMRMWVEYLSVDECVLVNFNDKAAAFPPTGYHRMRDRGGQPLTEKKAELIAAFDNARPGTYSDLLDGLRLAYSRPTPDLIILFTDGHPHIATKTDGGYGNAILREVSKHPKIPILSVAVGSYEVEGAGGPTERRNAAIAFLKELANQTGGNFIGR